MSNIRHAEITDLPRIVTIYNQAIYRGFCTADTSPVNVAQRKKWFDNHRPDQYPIYVYEKETKVIGWLSISPYRKGREALRYTAEVSYYVDSNYQRQGSGSALMEHAIDKMPTLNLKTIFAILLDVNENSIALLEKFGFKRWAHLPNIADFDGVECGQYYYGYQIN